MSPLLVQSCSKSKVEAENPVPAMELYSGFFFKIIKKAKRTGEFDNSIDICILSAEYGLITSEKEIEWYDRRMDTERATELASSVQSTLSQIVKGSYDEVIINVGGAYREALRGVSETLDADVRYIEGDGIGYKGQTLKTVIRGDFTVLDQPVSQANEGT